MGCYLQGEGHSEGLHVQNMTIRLYLLTNDSFATERSLLVAPRKPQRPMKILDCCGEGQGHSEHLKFLIIFLSGRYLLNLITFRNRSVVWRYIIVSRSIMRQDWFAFVKVKVTRRTHIFMTWSFLSSELLVPMQPGLIKRHHKPELFVERLDCCIHILGHRDSSKPYLLFVCFILSIPWLSLNCDRTRCVAVCSISSNQVVHSANEVGYIFYTDYNSDLHYL